MAYSVNDGLYTVKREGNAGEVGRFTTLAAAKAEAQLLTEASQQSHVVYKAEWQYTIEISALVVETDI